MPWWNAIPEISLKVGGKVSKQQQCKGQADRGTCDCAALRHPGGGQGTPCVMSFKISQKKRATRIRVDKRSPPVQPSPGMDWEGSLSHQKPSSLD